jgi:hypothetical protein
VRKCLDAHRRTIVVLTDGKLIEFYFLHLFSVIYYSIMTHLRTSKKISFLLSGDVNPGLTPLRRGLVKDSLYHAVAVACLSFD